MFASRNLVHRIQTCYIQCNRLLCLECVKPWSSLVVGDVGCIGQRRKLLCLRQTPQNYAAQSWHYSVGRYIFYCWADSIVHLLLLKSSMVKHKLGNNLFHGGLNEALGTFEENGKLGSATANRRWKLWQSQAVSCGFIKWQNKRHCSWRTITKFVWSFGRYFISF